MRVNDKCLGGRRARPALLVGAARPPRGAGQSVHSEDGRHRRGRPRQRHGDGGRLQRRRRGEALAGLVVGRPVPAQGEGRLLGKATFTQIPTGNTELDAVVAGRLPQSPAVETAIEYPSILAAGVARDWTEWTVVADVVFFGWTSFDELRLNFPTEPGLDSVIPENYKNIWQFRTGVERRLEEGWAVRFGYHYDRTPVPTESVSPLLPDNNRHCFVAGRLVEVGERARPRGRRRLVPLPRQALDRGPEPRRLQRQLRQLRLHAGRVVRIPLLTRGNAMTRRILSRRGSRRAPRRAPAAAQPSFAKYVAVGDSLTAGFTNGSLVLTHQADLVAALLARPDRSRQRQLPAALHHGPGRSRPSSRSCRSSPPSSSPPSRPDTGLPANYALDRPYDNLAVPGATSVDVVTAHDRAGSTTSILRGRGTQLQQAVSLAPTFVTLWIGSNDVLGAVTDGPRDRRRHHGAARELPGGLRADRGHARRDRGHGRDGDHPGRDRRPVRERHPTGGGQPRHRPARARSAGRPFP